MLVWVVRASSDSCVHKTRALNHETNQSPENELINHWLKGPFNACLARYYFTVARSMGSIQMTIPAIQLQDITLSYGKYHVIQQLNANINKGALLALIGANGTGKSTLLKALMGELKPLQGSIHLNGFSHQDIAYLPQRTSLEQGFPISVRDCVAMGLWRKIGAFGLVSSEQQRHIDQALETVGLLDMSETTLASLSGGQMQRALFARLMLQDAPVILLDEPFNAVDEQTIQDLMALVKQWHRQGRTILSVLHDQELVRHFFPETLYLVNGQGTLGNTAEILKQYHPSWAA